MRIEPFEVDVLCFRKLLYSKEMLKDRSEMCQLLCHPSGIDFSILSLFPVSYHTPSAGIHLRLSGATFGIFVFTST